MIALVDRFAQFFCIFVLFDVRLQCDQRVPANSADWLDQLQHTGCAAACLHSSPQLDLRRCAKRCTQQRFPANRTADTAIMQQLPAPIWPPIEMRVQQLCRDDISMQLQVEFAEPAVAGQIGDQNPKPLYIYRLQETNNLLGLNVVYITDSQTVHIVDLRSDRVYNVSATLIYPNNSYADATNNGALYGTQAEGLVTSLIPDVWFDEYKSEENELSVDVFWKPGADKSCFYKVVQYSSHDVDDELPELPLYFELTNRTREHMFQYRLHNLSFSKNYSIGVQALHRNPHLSNKLTWTELQTPDCQDLLGPNSDRCDPYVPHILNTSIMQYNNGLVHVTVDWVEPPHPPAYYTITVSDDNRHEYSANVSGTAIKHTFEHHSLDLYGHIVVRLVAYSANGRRHSRDVSIVNQMELSYHPVLASTHPHQMLIAQYVFVVSAAVTLLLFITGLCIFCWRSKKKFDLERTTMFDMEQNFMPSGAVATAAAAIPGYAANDEYMLGSHCLIVDDDKPAHPTPLQQLQKEIDASISISVLEIQPRQIRTVCVIGQGAFGLVHRATLQPDDRTVAVKTLRTDSQTVADMRAFCREMEVMKSVGPHPNIVGIVGHCTRDVSEMMLLTEYCDEGNLQGFLHRVYDNLHLQTNELQLSKVSVSEVSEVSETSVTATYANTLNSDSGVDTDVSVERDSARSSACITHVDNPSYMMTSDALVNGQEKPAAALPTHTIEIGSSDLVSFAAQCADGMRFLAQQKVVHRDLAARNVLVCSDKTVKISDFGLSRDVYAENVYMKQGDGMLPIKWMALESLLRRTYTSQSDVWSFGVLLYEVVTLGSTPYPTMQRNEELLPFLRGGGRMKCPDACSDELYALMSECWTEAPEKRPTFEEVFESLQKMLAEEQRYAGEVQHVRMQGQKGGAVKSTVVLRATEADASAYLRSVDA